MRSKLVNPATIADVKGARPAKSADDERLPLVVCWIIWAAVSALLWMVVIELLA
ncbi:MAG: hypothetical protein AAGL18_00470 [Pseudomonadota bacterium]